MNFDLFDIAGFVGVLLIVIGYLLLQLDKLPSSSLSFSLLNAAGSLLIMFSLIFKFNASAFLIEVFWFLISLNEDRYRNSLRINSNGRNKIEKAE